MNNQTYNIVLNQYNTNINLPFQLTFNFLFDWSYLPDQDYLVYCYFNSFRYIYKNGTLQYPYVLISTNAFQGLTYTNSQLINNQNSNIIGCVVPNLNGGLGYSYWNAPTGLNQNLVTYINGRPRNNNFFIKFLNGDLTGTYSTQEYDLGTFNITLKFIPTNNIFNIINKTNLSRQITFENMIKRNSKRKQSYNLILNLSNAYNNGSSGKDVDFLFDWSVMNNGAYIVYSTIITNWSPGWVGSSYQSFPVFNIDCFYGESYVNQQLIIQRSSTRLAIMYPKVQANNENFPTPYTLNEPIYINDRPNKNNFKITVLNNNGSGNYGFGVGLWILSLKFVPLD